MHCAQPITFVKLIWNFLPHTAIDNYEMVEGIDIRKHLVYGPHRKHTYHHMRPSGAEPRNTGNTGNTATGDSTGTGAGGAGTKTAAQACDPAILYFHGGGFVATCKESYYNSCTYLARRGYAHS